MQEALSLSFRPPAMLFGRFLSSLFQALGQVGLNPCVLRNYEGFPDNNVGGDVDLLIRPYELSRAIRALRSIQGIRIVGYTERAYVASFYLAGTSATPTGRSLQVDFVLSLTWKGLPYLPFETVLQAAVPRTAGDLKFFVPCAIHEAITSLLTSLLVAGWLKEKYLPRVRGTFTRDRTEVIAALLPQFGAESSTRMVESIISGDHRKVMSCVRQLRVTLAIRSFLRRPFRSAWAVARHYFREIRVRFSPANVETVCILDPGGCAKRGFVEDLLPLLEAAAKVVELRHPLSRSPFAQGAQEKQGEDGSFVSMGKTARWLLEEWRRQFLGKTNLTLRLDAECYFDLILNPAPSGVGGPKWFALLIGKLLPGADLWILLDPFPEGLVSKRGEVLSADELGTAAAYRAFVKTRERYIIVDANEPHDRDIERAYAAIIDTLVLRTERRLRSHSKSTSETILQVGIM